MFESGTNQPILQKEQHHTISPFLTLQTFFAFSNEWWSCAWIQSHHL